MHTSSLHRVGALLVALAVAGGLYWLLTDPGLAAGAGVLWGTATAVTLRVARLYPSRATGTAWADKRWTGLGAGLLTLAVIVGVGPTLSVSTDYRFGIGVLVLGAGFVGYATATMAELERGPA